MQAFLHFSSSKSGAIVTDFITEIVRQTGGTDFAWLSQSDELGASAFCRVSENLSVAALRAQADSHQIDVNILDRAPHVKRLMVCDMDSTIITSESLDDMSYMAGIGDKVAPITARAMAGEIDFSQALDERLAMLTGQPASLLDKIVKDTKSFTGARELVQTMRHKGAVCLLAR